MSAPISELAISAPPPQAGRADDAVLRRSLRACTAEGMLAEIVAACSGAPILTAWALHFGLGDGATGLLSSLPVVAQVFHLLGAWLTQSYGRRKVAIASNLASRLTWLGLPAVVLASPAPASAKAGLLVVAGLACALAIVGVNSWTAWVAEMVPTTMRGEYFGRRMAWTTATASVSALLAGAFLDLAGKHGFEGLALAGLSTTAALVGVACALLMRLQHDPGGEILSSRFDARAAVGPLRDPAARRFLVWTTAWNAANGLTTGFVNLYLLSYVGLPFAAVAAWNALTAMSRVAAMGTWGRLMARYGSGTLLAVSTVALALDPAAWLTAGPTRWWPLLVEAIVAGALSGGQNLAAFARPLEAAPAEGRPYWLAGFAGTAGLAYALSAVGAAAAVAALPDRLAWGGVEATDLQVLLAVAVVARSGSAVLAARMVDRRALAPVPAT